MHLGRASPALSIILVCSYADGSLPDCFAWLAQLSQTEALEGLVAPASAYVLMGQAGPVLIIIICFMAVTSSGASEMVAISSLFTFDVYRRYINPKVLPSSLSSSCQRGVPLALQAPALKASCRGSCRSRCFSCMHYVASNRSSSRCWFQG